MQGIGARSSNAWKLGRQVRVGVAAKKTGRRSDGGGEKATAGGRQLGQMTCWNNAASRPELATSSIPSTNGTLLRVNLTSQFLCCRAVARTCGAQVRTIVNIASSRQGRQSNASVQRVQGRVIALTNRWKELPSPCWSLVTPAAARPHLRQMTSSTSTTCSRKFR